MRINAEKIWLLWDRPSARIVTFLIIILIIWLVEFIDISALVSGNAPTPLNWGEAIIETIVAALLFFVSLLLYQYNTRHLSRINEQLRSQESLYRLLTDNSSDVIWMMDMNMQYIFVSPSIFKLTGYTPDEHLNMTIPQKYSEESVSRIHQIFEDKLNYIKEGDAGDVDFPIRIELQYYRKDGSTVWTEVDLNLYYNDNAELCGIVGSTRDISQEKIMLSRLHQQQVRYTEQANTLNAFFNALQAIALIVNSDGTILSSNRFLTDLLEVHHAREPENIFEILGEAHQGEIKKHLHDIENGSAPDQYRLSFHKRTYQCSAHLLPSSSSHANRFAILCYDITDLEQSQISLRVYQERVSLINKILRHDLMNHCSSMRSALRLYKRHDKKEFLESLGQILDKSIHLIKSMKDLEQFVRENPSLIPLELTDTLAQIIPSYDRIQFSITGSAKVMGDFALASVFDNIFKNALTHGQASKIAIKIQRDATQVTIEIADNGRGIPKKVKTRIFTESYIFGKTGNTGIGLDIVRRTIDRYGGSVDVQDNFPHGTIFTLVLHAG